MRERLLLVDAAALAFRAHYAFIKRPLTRADGRVTSALFGWGNTVLGLLQRLAPTHAAAALDTGRPNFRHAIYPAYKANRPPCPPELSWQLARLGAFSRALGVEPVSAEGFEADDVIGTLAEQAAGRGAEVFIVSGDKDFLQLLRPGITLLRPGREDECEAVGEEGVGDLLGVRASQVVDYLALLGDDSDNVPGAPGVGKVTASGLLAEHGDLDAVLAHAPAMKRKNLGAALVQHREQVLLSRTLVTIRRDLPGLPGPDALEFRGLDLARIEPELRDLEFPRLLARARTLAAVAHGAPHPPPEPLPVHAAPPAAAELAGHGQVRTREDLEVLLDRLALAPEVAVALPLGEEHPLAATPAVLAFSWEPGHAAALPLDRESLAHLGLADAAAAFRALLTRSVGGHDLKPLLLVLSRCGLRPAVAFDTYLEATVLRPGEADLGLDRLCLDDPDLRDLCPGAVLGSGRGRKTWAELPPPAKARHACLAADTTLRLHHRQQRELEARELAGVYRDLELPLLRVVADMEARGVTLDAGRLADLGREAEEELGRLTADIHAQAGQAFNINSTQQLGEVLFEKLKVQDAVGLKKVPKTRTGYATDHAVLQSLHPHPIAAPLLRYRVLSKLNSTYLQALPQEILPATGRVHTRWQQNGTATGRLASQSPNLQNIPLRTVEGARIRGAFVPSAPGHVILCADYSQIELRVLAQLSGVEAMIRAFVQGEDIHAATAAGILGLRQEDVTREQRGRAKAVNFGLIYGMGHRHLAQSTGMGTEEAKDFIRRYFAHFPGIKEYLDSLVALARERGWAETLAGRRRPLPDLRSDNGMIRNAAENMAQNTPVQGSAADIIKLAMLRLDRRVREEGLPLRLLLQVHDELVFECPAERAGELGGVVRAVMEDTAPLPGPFRVPLAVQVGTGPDWLTAHGG